MKKIKSKKHFRDSIVIGFALFSMFFGAGNVIFPPYLGLQSGDQWLLGFIAYYISDIGLAMLTIFVLLRTDGPDGITAHLGAVPAALLMSVVVLCIGPLVAIPRTAATTFEMTVLPLLPSASSLVVSVIFFAIILLLCVKESAVVDIVGKVLTPLLLLGLLVLIIKGVFSPLGEASDTTWVNSVVSTGLKAGYQTMDVLAAMVFGIIILRSASDKGYKDSVERNGVVQVAAVLSGVLLLIVYLGLAYLGASVSRIFTDPLTRAELIINIVTMLLGKTGMVIFGIVVALACVTTAVALVSSAASFFCKLSNGKIKYSLLVTVICVFSAAAANLGLDRIVAFASPILNVVYPPMLVVILLSIAGGRLPDWIYRVCVGAALVVSTLCTFSRSKLLSSLPLYDMDLAWLLPTLLVFALCLVVNIILKRRCETDEAADEA